MRKMLMIAAAAALLAPAAAYAQDGSSLPLGMEPYIGLMAGYHDFDSDNRGPLTRNCNGASGCVDGAVIEAVGGVNVPVGPVFVGVEGNWARGFSGIDWEYGVYGRFGARAGKSGLIYVKGGRQWIDPDGPGNKDDDWSYGMGVEVGPQDIGLGGLTRASGVRLRLEASTYDFQSIRPTAGIIYHF